MVALETMQHDHNVEEYRNFVDLYPLIKKWNERVRNSKNIKAYLDKRGPSVFPFPNKE